MTDKRLRELERRWRETGSVEDQAACLRARVQSGELRKDRLELAAYCGVLAAKAVGTGATAPDELGRHGCTVWISSVEKP